VENVLHELLDGRGLSWVEVSENTIAVKKKLEAEDKRIEGDTVATITVTGKVVDENGEPVVGATVLVKGSKTGTTTNVWGDFSLKGIHANAWLIISNVSYLTEEIAIKGRNIIGRIQLKQYVKPLDEIQIQAYGTTSRRVSTGNISTIKAEDIAKSPVSNPLLAIVGRAPGIFIEQSSGVPGGGVKVRIQGQNSLQKGNDPLYVVDGVPYTSQLLPGLNGADLGSSGSTTGGNPLNFINPQDIESIDILKDADATAIYGSRAANGAILITTKKGQMGRTSVSLNIQQGFGRVTRKMALLNTQQYLEMRKEAKVNDNAELIPGPYGDVDLTKYSQSRYTDWQKEFLGGTSAYTNAQASISGGSESTQFIFSGGYQRQSTVTPGDLTDQKASFHISVNNTSPNKKFIFSFSANYLADRNKLAAVSALANNAFILPPNAPALYNSDGSLNWETDADGVPTFFNPLNALKQRNINKTNNLLANTSISYQLIPGLLIKTSFGYNKLQSNEVAVSPIGQYPASVKAYQVRSSSFNYANINSWIIEPQIVYNKSLGKGLLEGILGSSIQHQNKDRLNLNAQGFTSDLVLENVKAAATVAVDGASDATIFSKYKYFGLFGRVNYSWGNKYIASANIRKDGSSRFGDKNKYNIFWSVSGAWIFSNEDRVKEGLPFLSFGKLKVSYGRTGSDQIGDYGYLNVYNSVSGITTPYQGIVSLEPQGNFPNPYLQWEETNKLSSSIDIGIFKDKILLNATYYRNRSSNQLLSIGLPSITGGFGVPTNVPATIQNTGWEFNLTFNNIARKDFTWTTYVNGTIPQNKLLSYGGVDSSFYISQGLIGRPVGIRKVYHFLGVNASTGIYQFADKDGHPTSTPDPNSDKTIFVNLNPQFYGGFGNIISYKRITLDFLFQVVKQNGGNNYFGNAPAGLQANQPTTVLSRWQRAGDVADIQRYNSDGSLSDPYFKATESDKAISDASYIRLKNVSLSWQLPQVWAEKIQLQGLRLYLQGQNLLTITSYRGLDPENRTLNALPPLRILAFGLQAGL
jgi:TonB-linked SusC/RagA family outer membrane protein